MEIRKLSDRKELSAGGGVLVNRHVNHVANIHTNSLTNGCGMDTTRCLRGGGEERISRALVVGRVGKVYDEKLCVRI